jgi:hypothetical protein
MIFNPLLAVAGALLAALAVTIAHAWRIRRRVRRKAAQLRRTRAELSDALAARNAVPPATGLRLSAADVVRPLPKQLWHRGEGLIVVRVRRRPHTN